MDPDTWPMGVSVREFLQKPKLGDFIDTLNTPKLRESQREKKQRLAEKNEQKSMKPSISEEVVTLTEQMETGEK